MSGRAGRALIRRIGTGAEFVSDAKAISDSPQSRRRARSAARLQQETRGGQPGGGRAGSRAVRHRRRDQEGSGRARSLARARLNWFCQGQPWGRCRVRRRALRVAVRPGRRSVAGGSWWLLPVRPDRCALSSGPGYGRWPGRPARRRWRGSVPRGDG